MADSKQSSLIATQANQHCHGNSCAEICFTWHLKTVKSRQLLLNIWVWNSIHLRKNHWVSLNWLWHSAQDFKKMLASPSIYLSSLSYKMNKSSKQSQDFCTTTFVPRFYTQEAINYASHITRLLTKLMNNRTTRVLLSSWIKHTEGHSLWSHLLSHIYLERWYVRLIINLKRIASW